MGNVSLGGFDVVVHLAESVINRGLGLIPNGSTFPVRQRKDITLTALAVPVLGGGTRNVPLLYDAFLEADRPQITLNQSNGTVTIHLNLSPASQLTFLRPVSAADAALLTGVIPQIGLAGSISLDCPFDRADVSAVLGGIPVAGRAAVARAANVSATIGLVVPSADGGGNVPIASSAVIPATLLTISTATIQTALASAFGALFGNAIGDLPLTNPVRLNAGATPVQTVRDVVPAISPAGTPPAVSLGVLTAVEPASPGGAVPPPPPEVGDALGVVLGVANYWTLQLVCSAMTAAHPGMRFTVNQNPPSASFSGAVVIPGGETPVKVRKIDITVDPNGGLDIVGQATASDTCWDATIDFDFTFTFTCDPATGAIVAASSIPNVVPHVDKSIWCQILGAIIGAIGGFIVGAIVGALIGGSSGGPFGAILGGAIGGIAGAIGGAIAANQLIDPLDLDGVSLDSLNVLGGLTLPLPIGGAGFLVQTCSFDDLVAAGNLVFVDFAERHRTGTVQLTAGSGFDLDAGVVRPSLDGVSDDAADLFWTGSQLQVLPGARTGPQFDWRSNAFDTLSLTDLERFTYNTAPVPLTALVRRSLLGAAVTFAVRTDEGRFAKCRARRDLSGRCKLEYIVYERPPACLSTILTLDTLSQKVVDKGTETCTDVHDVVPFRPFVDVKPLTPPAVATAVLLEPAAELGRVEENLVHFPDLQDIFDRDLVTGGVLDPGRFPQRPPKPCGTHTTVENREVPWQVVERKQRITLQALAVGLTPPITFEWDVFGTELAGSGTKKVGDVDVTFDENSPVLTLTAKNGVDVAGSIIVHATDADGIHASTTRHVNSPSRIRLGGCCVCGSGKLTLADAAAQLGQLQVAQRVYDAGVARLRRIASAGQVREVQTVTLAEAAAQLRRKK